MAVKKNDKKKSLWDLESIRIIILFNWRYGGGGVLVVRFSLDGAFSRQTF